MKTIIMIAAGALAVGCTNAQKAKGSDVPAPVKDGFAKEYPGTKAEKWEKEGADYEAEFDWNGVESSAVFDANGVFKELEQEIKATELPAAVTTYCTTNYAGYRVTEAAKITNASGKVFFEAEMKKGKEQFDLLFNEQGDFVKKGE